MKTTEHVTLDKEFQLFLAHNNISLSFFISGGAIKWQLHFFLSLCELFGLHEVFLN